MVCIFYNAFKLVILCNAYVVYIAFDHLFFEKTVGILRDNTMTEHYYYIIFLLIIIIICSFLNRICTFFCNI